MAIVKTVIRLLLAAGAVLWGGIAFALARAALVPHCLGIAAAPGYPGGIICDSFWQHSAVPVSLAVGLFALAVAHLFLALRPRRVGDARV